MVMTCVDKMPNGKTCVYPDVIPVVFDSEVEAIAAAKKAAKEEVRELNGGSNFNGFTYQVDGEAYDYATFCWNKNPNESDAKFELVTGYNVHAMECKG